MQNEMVMQHHEHEHHHDADANDIFGFWLYIMTDCVLFATLFAAFVVLNYQAMTINGLKNYIDLSVVLTETFFLLASNFTFCLSILSFYKKNVPLTQFWLLLTFILGASFVYLEVKEFIHLAADGFRWDLNGSASSFFTLVGTHGFHVSCGLIWILLMIFQLFFFKTSNTMLRRMTYLGLFWNFLDIVWIFVFTVVYLMGAI